MGGLDGWRWGWGANRVLVAAGRSPVAHGEAVRRGCAQDQLHLFVDMEVFSSFSPLSASIPFVSTTKFFQCTVPASTKWNRKE